jgi:hypothetical protein
MIGVGPGTRSRINGQAHILGLHLGVDMQPADRGLDVNHFFVTVFALVDGASRQQQATGSKQQRSSNKWQAASLKLEQVHSSQFAVRSQTAPPLSLFLLLTPVS